MKQKHALHTIIYNVKWSCYRPGVAQRVVRGIAVLFHNRGTRRRWVVSRTPRPQFTPEKDPVPILREAGWAAGPVWTGRKSHPHQDSIPEFPARSQSLYQLSYPAHTTVYTMIKNGTKNKKECDKRWRLIIFKLCLIYRSSNNGRPSLHFITLHLTTLVSTSPHFT